MCPEYMAGWWARLGIVTPVESREYLDEAASLVELIGPDTFNGNRVAFRSDGERLTEE